jgi:hypothetical protein
MQSKSAAVKLEGIAYGMNVDVIGDGQAAHQHWGTDAKALSVSNFALCAQLLTDKAWELFVDNSKAV